MVPSKALARNRVIPSGLGHSCPTPYRRRVPALGSQKRKVFLTLSPQPVSLHIAVCRSLPICANDLVTPPRALAGGLTHRAPFRAIRCQSAWVSAGGVARMYGSPQEQCPGGVLFRCLGGRVRGCGNELSQVLGISTVRERKFVSVDVAP
jgi:hypothetical protein